MIYSYSYNTANIISGTISKVANDRRGYGAQAYKDCLAVFTALGEIILRIAKKADTQK
jgi:hypothetical protein